MPDYFDQLLERSRDIRASERRLYLRVREIFAVAADYEPSAKGTQHVAGFCRGSGQAKQAGVHEGLSGETRPVPGVQ
ncbi:RhuM family protein [Aquisalimonas sp. 2447]|uniref:RhuM family protein n=1 Tax=Aquisalimonas sp. 2447 TaxID=2740807 RepID=UPI001C2C5CCE|nr:RhuM family protein [Aquisalimonas sp. 2447]